MGRTQHGNAYPPWGMVAWAFVYLCLLGDTFSTLGLFMWGVVILHSTAHSTRLRRQAGGSKRTSGMNGT